MPFVADKVPTTSPWFGSRLAYSESVVVDFQRGVVAALPLTYLHKAHGPNMGQTEQLSL